MRKSTDEWKRPWSFRRQFEIRVCGKFMNLLDQLHATFFKTRRSSVCLFRLLFMTGKVARSGAPGEIETMHSLGRFLLLIALTFTVFVQADPSADPYACSASQPCKIGCCGKNNVCGLGPDYCSPSNCLNSCSAKSDCDPGWGPQWSNKESCPLNVCCSKYGFCGTTSEFCGDSKVKSPSCTGGNSAAQKVIGYYEGWSSTRVCKGCEFHYQTSVQLPLIKYSVSRESSIWCLHPP